MEEAPPELSLSSQTQEEDTERKGPLSALLALSAKPISRTMPLCEDYIGSESCDDMVPLTNQIGAAEDSVKAQSMHVIDRRSILVREREFPPLIPSLARTENLPSRMPWVLRRLHTSDGRLILREEKVRYHEYFKAHRSGGRLTLQLVPLEDDGFHLPVVDPETDDIDVNNYGEEIPEEYEEGAEPASEKEEEPLTPDVERQENAEVGGGGSGGSGGDWKCSFSTVSPKPPCFFGVAAVAAALGPVLG